MVNQPLLCGLMQQVLAMGFGLFCRVVVVVSHGVLPFIVPIDLIQIAQAVQLGTKGTKKPWDCSLLPVPTVEEISSPVLSYLILNEADLL
jgi:hypothetical protein